MTSRRTYEFSCEVCGRPFTAQRRDKRFCSTSCLEKERYRRTVGRKLAAQRENVPCEYCGQLFTAQRADRRYCSRNCGRKAYAATNREAIRIRQRQWVENNPEKRQATLQRFMERHPEDGKKRYARLKADPERLTRMKQKQREHYLANREEYIERARQRQQAQPTKHYDYRHGRDWDELFAELFQEQLGKCYLCGSQLDLDGYRKIHLDHDHRCCPKGKTCEKCRRGLACSECNVLIGLAQDNPDRLHYIADNLTKAIELVNRRVNR